MPAASILCTDGAAAYRAVAKRKLFPLAPQQYVNAYDSRLKQWMVRFNGVATKYLPNYLGWRRLLEHEREQLTPQTFLPYALGKTNE